MAIVLFGSTASMIVDVEETCARLGVAIRAIVRNVEGKDHALARDLEARQSAFSLELLPGIGARAGLGGVESGTQGSNRQTS